MKNLGFMGAIFLVLSTLAAVVLLATSIGWHSASKEQPVVGGVPVVRDFKVSGFIFVDRNKNGLLDAGEVPLNLTATLAVYRDNGDEIFDIARDARIGRISTTSGFYQFTGSASQKIFFYLEPASEFGIVSRNPQVLDVSAMESLHVQLNFATVVAEQGLISLPPSVGGLPSSNVYSDEKAVLLLRSLPVGGEISSSDIFDVGQLAVFQIWMIGSLGVFSWSAYLSFRLAFWPRRKRK